MYLSLGGSLEFAVYTVRDCTEQLQQVKDDLRKEM